MNMSTGLATLMGMGTFAAIVILILAVWSIAWKGFALWIAAKEDKKWWFIPILIFNTAGILEIIFIFLFSESGKKYVSHIKAKRVHKKAHKNSKKHIAHKEIEESSE